MSHTNNISFSIDDRIIQFKIQHTNRDGACFFNTLSLALFGSQERAFEIRRDVVRHIADNYDQYREFITHPTEGHAMTLEDYKSYMLRPSTYATFLELNVASTILMRRIIVVDASNTQICDVGNREWEVIVSLFSGDLNSGHFDLLWPFNNELPGSFHNNLAQPIVETLSKMIIEEKASTSFILEVEHSALPSMKNWKAGRPKKNKRGRPKKSDTTSQEQHLTAVQKYSKTNPEVHQKAVKCYNLKNPEVHREAVKRYDLTNPEVHREAVKRYDLSNPQVNREAVKRYSESHPDVNISAVKRYRKAHPEKIRKTKHIPASVRKHTYKGEYTGTMLDTVKLFSLKNQSLFSNDIYKCKYCHARLFLEEKGRKKWCCCNGAYIVPEFPNTNPEFYDHPHFLTHPRAYNNLFAFSALGVSHGFQQPKTGISFLKIQGRTYHRVFDLAYSDTHNPAGMYIDDGEERVRLAEGRGLDVSVVKAITDYLVQKNPFINLLKQLSREPSDDAHLIFEATTRRTHGPVLGDAPRSTEIAAIISTEREQFNPRHIVIWKIGAKKPHTIDVFHPLYESLQYPLLYPHGTPGWHIGLLDNTGKKISQVKYYRRLLLSEPRFSQLGRLSEEWMVDMYCRTEEERLRFISRMQNTQLATSMRIAPYNELQGAGNTDSVRALGADETIQGEGGIVPGRIYLPNSFTGSARYMQTKYMDGMSIVSRLGRPSYFLTVTCNPRWPEIVESTPRGHKANAGLVSRVFHLKLLELLRDLRSGVFFGKKVYLLYVIEFQKRGLPHSHICFRVEGGGPTHSVDIDKVVRANIPSVNEAGGRLRAMVMNHMIHGPCGPPNRTNLPCWDSTSNKCTKYFPKPQTEVTHVDDRGFVHLKRDHDNTAEVTVRRRSVVVNDTWVVPYNAALLLKYDCHINLEIASTRKIIKYLFKYITKGSDEARVAVIPASDVYDEVEMYATKRYIGACDAAWRLLEFEISGREPNVIQLPVHLEGQHSVVFRKGQEADAAKSSSSNLLLYFNRPSSPEFDNLTYLDFFEQYLIHSRKPSRSSVPVVPHPDGTHFITKRQRGEMVARLFWVAPNRGELFYLRVLLNNYPCKSYSELKSLGGEACRTFQAAARHLGLVNDEMEYEEALKEAQRFMTPYRLRRFFALLLIAGARGSDIWDKFKDLLTEDLLEKHRSDHQKAYTLALIQIDRSLRRHGISLSDHGLPDVKDDSTELGRELLQYSLPQLSSFTEEWIPRLSSEQRVIFDHVHSLVRDRSSDRSKSIFIDGPAGSGKTLLLNVLSASLRLDNFVVLCAATSGIAAQNYEGGVTAHSLFKLPLNIDTANATWGVTGGSQRAELIRAAEVIIFDEAPMAHKKLIQLLDKSLRDLMQRNVPFGSKIVVFAGDFRQIPPVVVGARSSNDVVSSSFRFSPLWPTLEKFKLFQAQRTRDDSSYSEVLLQIGNGSLSSGKLGEGIHSEELISLEGINYVSEVRCLIDFVFQSSLLIDPDACAKRALLCVTNNGVDTLNAEILKELPGEPVHLLSVNYVEDANADDFFLSAEALANVHAKGVPDHDLVLKRNSLCMIIRNLHFDDGLLNGTKVIVVDISIRVVTVRKPGCQELYSIPRITFQAPVEPGSPLMMYRRQFPLRLSYAITINKAQGQTIDLIGIDLRSDVFCHGQLYVALGRVRSKDSVTVLVNPDRVINGVVHVRNVVYQQLISN